MSALGQLAGRRNRADILVRHRDRPVDQVAPFVGQLEVDPADELLPGEVRVLVLGPVHGDEVAQGVRTEVAQEIADVDHVPARAGQLGAGHGQELRGDDLGGQVQRPERGGRAAPIALTVRTEQDAGPDHRVEGDVVLAHEVVRLGVRIGPEPPPGVRVTRPLGPLDRRRQVADHGIEPHVDALHRCRLPVGQRDRHPPVEVTGDRPGSQFGEQVLAELQHVGTPVGAGLQPLAEGPGQRRQVKEEVLGLDELRGLAVDPRPWVDQIDRIELPATVVALITPGAVVAAVRAGAFDVAVGQRASGRRADRTQLPLGGHVAVGMKGAEELLDDLAMVDRGGTRVEVVAAAQAGQVLGDHPVILVGGLLRRQPLLVGLHLDRGAVLIGSRHHQHVVAGHPHVAREDVRGNAETGDVADVPWTVGVRPGHGGQDG